MTTQRFHRRPPLWRLSLALFLSGFRMPPWRSVAIPLLMIGLIVALFAWMYLLGRT